MVKIQKLIFPLVVSLLLVATLANALAITAPYWPGYPLTMNPGESIDLVYDIQNMVGEDDVTIKVEITEGKEIASLTALDIYPVKIKDGISVPFKVSIPKDTPLGTKYKVTASFYSVSNDINKPVQLSTKVIKSFEVFIGQEKKANEPATQEVSGQQVKESKPGSSSSTMIIIVILVILLVWFLLRKKRKK